MKTVTYWMWWMIAVNTATVGCKDAHAAPTPGDFTGTQTVSVSATAAYGSRYPTRHFAPKLEITASRDGNSERTVTIIDHQYAEEYKCTLAGKVVHGILSLTAAKPCTLQMVTPDFCLLKPERCAARTTGLTCQNEKSAGNLGTLSAKLLSGTMSEDAGGKWHLSLEYTVDGCVLADGYNHNAPVTVKSGRVSGRTP